MILGGTNRGFWGTKRVLGPESGLLINKILGDKTMILAGPKVFGPHKLFSLFRFFTFSPVVLLSRLSKCRKVALNYNLRVKKNEKHCPLFSTSPVQKM